LNVMRRYRLPIIHLVSHVPLISLGGLDGSVHILRAQSHLPASASSFLCISPGAAAFIMASMAAFSSGVSAFFTSSARSVANAASVGKRPARTIVVRNMLSHLPRNAEHIRWEPRGSPCQAARQLEQTSGSLKSQIMEICSHRPENAWNLAICPRIRHGY